MLEGAPIAEKIKAELREKIALLKDTQPPYLVALLVGENAGSKYYAKSQQRDCEALGIGYELREISGDISEEDMLAVIDGVNRDDAITGVILLVPVPEQLDARTLQAAIDPVKDVDGVHPANLGCVVQASTFIRGPLAPCTAQAAVRMVEESGVDVEGAELVVVGRSEIVGKPVALLMLEKRATVTVCHTATRDIIGRTSQADILVVAAGRAHLVTPEWVKPGALVVDVGINRIKDENGKSKMAGDVDPAVAEVAGILTPVPGGVGPVTAAMLMRNVVVSAAIQAERR